MKSAMATCTMAKVMRHSGPFSNEGVNVGLQIGRITPEPGNEESLVKKRCDKLKESFYQNLEPLKDNATIWINRFLEAQDINYQDYFLETTTSFKKKRLIKGLPI